MTDTPKRSYDLEKRKRIMRRSLKLGHCICDPSRGCPCDIFRNDGHCPCAGERPAPKGDIPPLTTLVHNAGCASKISAADLEAILHRLKEPENPNVVVGMAASDDAGVYRLDDGTLLVQTVDVMTPCVDDPRLFGRICAANCLSDIYAMGGTPKTAVSVVGFPIETLPGDAMYEMLAGALEVFEESNVALLGGHSVKDAEIKLGFAITGTIAPEDLAEHNAAKAGDLLVLAKPLGTGVLGFSHRIGRVDDDVFAAAVETMAQQNNLAAEAMRDAGAAGCTDVTGFGLFGHLASMLRASGASAEIWAEALPALPMALEEFAEDVVPGGVERNMEYVGDDLTVEDGVSDAQKYLGFDAQTSGGLLIAVSQEQFPALAAALAERNQTAWTIGRILDGEHGAIHLRQARPADDADPVSSPCCCSEEPAPATGDCCADAPAEPSCCSSSTTSASLDAFAALMASATADGAIDAKTKELITFALVVQGRCAPCFAHHYKRAKDLGLTDAQLDEAAWLATAIGGAVVRMFYLEQKQALAKSAAPSGGCCSDSGCC